MNFERFDIVMLVTMSLAIIGMVFTMPALGLTSASTSESDIPQFDIKSDRFDFAGDFPDSPGTPSTGTMWIRNNEVNVSENFIDLDSNDNFVMFQETDVSNPDMKVSLVDTGASTQEDLFFNQSSIGDSKVVDHSGYEVVATLTDKQNVSEADFYWELDYQIREQPSDESWIGRLPGVGTLYSAGETLAQIVAWIGSVLFWGIKFMISMALNIVGIMFDVATYLVGMLAWLSGTYLDIVSSAGGWAGLFVAVPGIIVFLIFAKMGMIVISLLPFT